MKVLAGDVGGTSTRLALYDVAGPRPRELARDDFASAQADDLAAILQRFEDACGSLAGLVACLGLPGPVHGRVVQTTNLPWTVDAAALERRFELGRVVLLNDLEAAAWGLEALDDDGITTLRRGADDAAGNRAVIAAGTGLGEAGLAWNGDEWLPFATEGGHASFAPTCGEDDDLLRFARRDLDGGHVSVERLLSGPGLVRIYRFELERRGMDAPGWFRKAIDSDDDPAAAITTAADEDSCPAAVSALRRFVRVYGAEAGDLALKMMATGGVFLAGGIAPKIRRWLEDDDFEAAFLAKGRMRSLMERMPVRLVLDGRLALTGAARRAVRE